MDSALRPRDIQARIRSGQSPEAVADAARLPLDKILVFAHPVLAERRHVAGTAWEAALRRRAGDGPGRPLGEVVAERLRSDGADPHTPEWDAWRRDDGKWTVAVRFVAGSRQGEARFTYDPLGRYAVPADDDARWLAGEPDDNEVAASVRRPRRLAAVPVEAAGAAEAGRRGQLAFDDGADPDEDTAELTAVADAVNGRRAPEPVVTEPPARPERRRARRGRASVPTWDEIMFGRQGRD